MRPAPELDLLTRARERAPDRVFLRDGGASWTFEELARAVDLLLQTHPVHREAHVQRDEPPLWCLDAPVSSAWIVFLLAAWRAGHRVLPLGRRLAPAEREALLARVGADRVVTPRELENWQPHLEAARTGPRRETAFHPGAESWVLTSGSSGSPRVARLAWASQVAHAHLSVRTLGLGPDDTWWADLPMNHVGGLGIVVRSLVSGCCIWLRDRVDPVAMDEALGAGLVSHVSVVPTTYLDWLAARGDRPVPATLKAMLVGGSGTRGVELGRCECALPTYGLTEAGSHVTLGRPGQHATDGWGDGGWPLPGIEVRLGDPSRTPDPGDEGPIFVRSPGMFTGYVDDPVATKASLVDGWLATGDRGQLGDDGRLWIRARESELIVSGGENLAPSEIELAINSVLPDRVCVVVGRADRRWGHVPVVVFEGVVPEGWSLERLRDALDPWLGRHKHPRDMLAMERFPRLPGGKLNRRALAHWVATGEGS
ncbi:MAG: AMP-binding protein [bacterium]|nr:AMP-binding protein [bacterium]